MKNSQGGNARASSNSYSKEYQTRGGKKSGKSRRKADGSLERQNLQSNIHDQRSQERAHILQRQMNEAGLYICPVCNLPITSGFDVHEVFVTRGHVRGCPPEVQKLIHSAINQAALHPGQCHQDAQFTDAGKRACAVMIVKKEGAIRVIRWLRLLGTVMTTTTVNEEIRYVENLELGNVSVPVAG